MRTLAAITFYLSLLATIASWALVLNGVPDPALRYYAVIITGVFALSVLILYITRPKDDLGDKAGHGGH
jgi:hypothetical protein